MNESLTVVPTYGRDYKSKKEVQKAWDDDQDFEIAGPIQLSGRKVNKSDVKRYSPGAQVWARYAKLTKVVEVK